MQIPWSDFCCIGILNFKPVQHCFSKTILKGRDGSQSGKCSNFVFYFQLLFAINKKTLGDFCKPK